MDEKTTVPHWYVWRLDENRIGCEASYGPFTSRKDADWCEYALRKEVGDIFYVNDVPGIPAKAAYQIDQENSMTFNPFADPASDWDEDDGYEYDDTKADLDAPAETAPLLRPDYIGIVTGAQYKLENAYGVTSYALVVAKGRGSMLFEVADDDLECLARQIDGLLKRG